MTIHTCVQGNPIPVNTTEFKKDGGKMNYDHIEDIQIKNSEEKLYKEQKLVEKFKGRKEDNNKNKNVYTE